MVDSLRPPVPGSDDRPRTVHPKGQVQLVLADVIDLGDRVDDYDPKKPKLVHALALLYCSSKINPDTERPFELSYECTLSWGEKANLRKWLGQQRGEPFTDDEARNPPDLASYVGTNVIGTVVQQVSKGKGRTYAKLTAVVPLMDGMTPIPVPAGYQRAKWWAERQAENRKAAEAFTRGTQTATPVAFDQMPAALDDNDSDLPF